MDDKEAREKPVKAESQIRTWVAVLVVGLVMLAAGQGDYWEPFGQLGAFMAAAGAVGIVWLLAKDRDKRG